MKEFLPYDQVRNNSLKMAHKILKDGFVPDVIYVSLRGGAYVANVGSEIGRAHVWTPVKFRNLVCRLLLEQKTSLTSY